MSSDKPKLTGFQVMGMTCWKCKGEVGCLEIPFDQPDTPESLGALLASKRILPMCMSCFKANPRVLSFENANEGR